MKGQPRDTGNTGHTRRRQSKYPFPKTPNNSIKTTKIINNTDNRKHHICYQDGICCVPITVIVLNVYDLRANQILFYWYVQLHC